MNDGQRDLDDSHSYALRVSQEDNHQRRMLTDVQIHPYEDEFQCRERTHDAFFSQPDHGMFISEAISKEASFVEPNLLKKRKIASPDSKERNHQQQQMPPKTDREILEDKAVFNGLRKPSGGESYNSYNEGVNGIQRLSIQQYYQAKCFDEESRKVRENDLLARNDLGCNGSLWGFQRLDEDAKYDWVIEDIFVQSNYSCNTGTKKNSQILGKGAFGSVIKAKDNNTSKQYALKFIKKSFYSKAITETEIMKRFQHNKQIIQYHDIYVYDQQTQRRQVIEIQQYLVIVMELASASLDDILRQRVSCQAHWSYAELLTLFKQLASAVQVLTDKRIAHRDIKPSNILYCLTSMSYKLADFGEAKVVESVSFDEPHSPRGTKRYMSPELLNGLKRKKEGAGDQASIKESKVVIYEPYSNDIYSLGVVFFQLKMLDDLTQYHGHNFKSQETEEYFTCKLKNDQDSLDEFISRMIAIDPRSRPQIKEVLQFIHKLERIRLQDSLVPLQTVSYSRNLAASSQQQADIQAQLDICERSKDEGCFNNRGGNSKDQLGTQGKANNRCIEESQYSDQRCAVSNNEIKRRSQATASKLQYSQCQDNAVNYYENIRPMLVQQSEDSQIKQSQHTVHSSTKRRNPSFDSRPEDYHLKALVFRNSAIDERVVIAGAESGCFSFRNEEQSSCQSFALSKSKGSYKDSSNSRGKNNANSGTSSSFHPVIAVATASFEKNNNNIINSIVKQGKNSSSGDKSGHRNNRDSKDSEECLIAAAAVEKSRRRAAIGFCGGGYDQSENNIYFSKGILVGNATKEKICFSISSSSEEEQIEDHSQEGEDMITEKEDHSDNASVENLIPCELEDQDANIEQGLGAMSKPRDSTLKNGDEEGENDRIDELQFVRLMESQKQQNTSKTQRIQQYIARASAYESLLKFQKARETYQELYQSHFQCLSPLDQINLLKNLGRLEHKMSKFASSIRFYQQLLELLKQSKELNDLQISEVYQMLGSAHFFQGDYETALSYYHESLTRKEKQRDHIEEEEIADLLVYIGLVQKHLQQYRASLANYENALRIINVNPGKNLKRISLIKKNIGMVYDHLQNNSSSITFLESALQDTIKAYGYESERVVNCLNKIGVVMVHSGPHNHAAAISEFEKAMKIMKKLYKMDTLNESHCRQFRFKDEPLGEADQPLYNRALSVNEEAYILYRQVYDYYHVGVAIILEIRGMIYHYLKDFRQSLKYYSEASNIYSVILKPQHEFAKRSLAFVEMAKKQHPFTNFPNLI